MISLAGLFLLCQFRSQVGLSHCGNSRCHLSTPSVQKKKDMSFIDSLLRIGKLFQKPSIVPLASDWGHSLRNVPKWMPCPLWLRLSFWAYHCGKNNGLTFPEIQGMIWGREIIKWKSGYHSEWEKMKEQKQQYVGMTTDLFSPSPM